MNAEEIKQEALKAYAVTEMNTIIEGAVKEKMTISTSRSYCNAILISGMNNTISIQSGVLRTRLENPRFRYDSDGIIIYNTKAHANFVMIDIDTVIRWISEIRKN